jgi:outer membrane protein TolC
MTTEQVAIQSNVLENYQTLLNVEIEKFRIGESSIFLLNSREQKLMETQLKLAKLQSKYQKLRRKLDWASGQLR